MDRPFDDGEISVVEDLDPEPPRGRGLQARELILGLVILFGVLGYVGWQWWQQWSVETSYISGKEAEARQDWDKALDYYSSASGYKDANTLASNASHFIIERNQHYYAALVSKNKGEWFAALEEIEATRTIQKDYRDSAAIQDEAYLHASVLAYRQALSGTIAMRPLAQPPGLYYRTAEDWVWLQDSDAFSRVINLSSSSSYVLYDVPGPGWTPPIVPTTTADSDIYTPVRPGSPELVGRRLMAMSLEEDEPAFATFGFDPSLYDLFVQGSKGVWVYRFADDEGSVFSLPLFNSFYGTHEPVYVPLIGELTSTVQLPGSNWAIMGTHDQNDQLLLEEWENDGTTSGSIHLYIADATARNLRSLYTINGNLFSAELSDDGNYALLVTARPSGVSNRFTETILLMDIRSGFARTLSEDTNSYDARGPILPADASIHATFVQQGAYAGYVLLVENGQRTSIVNLINPEVPLNPFVSVSVPGRFAPYADIIEQDGNILITGERGYFPGSAKASMTVLLISPTEGPVIGKLPTDDAYEPLEISIHDGRVVYNLYDVRQRETYRLQNPTSTPMHYATLTTYNMPISQLGKSKAAPIQVYSGTLQWWDFTLARPGSETGMLWNAGPQMLAYIDKGKLFVRSYDGSVIMDLTGDGVTALYDVSSYQGHHTLP